MKKAAEYRKHAEQCRQLAATATSDFERHILMEMAEMWEQLAQRCEQQHDQASN
jgi:hypothetical protein